MPRDERHSRSRSPAGSSHRRRRSERSRSPDRHRHRHHHHRHHGRRDHGSQKDKDRTASRQQQRTPAEPPLPVILPYKAPKLSKHDLDAYRPLFASYLDIQKHKDIFGLDEDETRGRWKSFLGKWNRGELPEGWYDPEMKAKADASFADEEAEYASAAATRHTPPASMSNAAPRSTTKDPHANTDLPDEDSDTSSSSYGPAAPGQNHHTNARTAPRSRGPAIPTFADLADRDDQDRADARAARTNSTKRSARSPGPLDPPRAEPGTRERMLEKRREAAAANAAYRDARAGAGAGDMPELRDRELLGGDDVRGQQEREARRKTEREIRREEALRARQAERDDKVAELRAREEGTMDMLRALARERFG